MATVTVDNNQLPETTNQEAETNVMVEDGKTLVIGGLITDNVKVNQDKGPVLGDIPWLGDLFLRAPNHEDQTGNTYFLDAAHHYCR